MINTKTVKVRRADEVLIWRRTPMHTSIQMRGKVYLKVYYEHRNLYIRNHIIEDTLWESND